MFILLFLIFFLFNFSFSMDSKELRESRVALKKFCRTESYLVNLDNKKRENLERQKATLKNQIDIARSGSIEEVMNNIRSNKDLEPLEKYLDQSKKSTDHDFEIADLFKKLDVNSEIPYN